jgi:hypothetical protein
LCRRKVGGGGENEGSGDEFESLGVVDGDGTAETGDGGSVRLCRAQDRSETTVERKEAEKTHPWESQRTPPR